MILPLVFILVGSFAFAQQASVEGPENDSDRLAKLSDDVLWHLELADIAEVRTKKSPLIVLVHEGVYSNQWRKS